MAHPATLKQLEARRKELVLQNDVLRGALADRCAEVGAASFWVLQGYELAERLLANNMMLSTALNLFRRFRSG
jgi:hypothetical protein